MGGGGGQGADEGRATGAAAALDEAADILNQEANSQQLDQAKNMAGTDVMQFMMLVMPVATTMLAPVLVKYGFPGDQQGAIMFLAACRKHETDEEIRAKASALKQKFVPEALAPMLLQMMGGGA